jgi:hypothetical protein
VKREGQGVGSWMLGRRQQVLISENFEQSAALDLVVESNWGRSGHV